MRFVDQAQQGRAPQTTTTLGHGPRHTEEATANVTGRSSQTETNRCVFISATLVARQATPGGSATAEGHSCIGRNNSNHVSTLMDILFHVITSRHGDNAETEVFSKEDWNHLRINQR